MPTPHTLRRATPADAAGIAALDAARHGWDTDAITTSIRAALERGRDKVWVVVTDRVVAHGKVVFVDAKTTGPDARGVRTGFHLMGVVVDPAMQRRGLGSALVRARVDWIASQGGTEALYFTAHDNHASLSLHDGFERIADDVRYPRLLEQKRQVLHRLPLMPRHPLRLSTDVPTTAVMALYEAVGWTAYTREPDTLMRSIAGSTFVATRWDDQQLIALCRVVSDDAGLAYLQDVLVHPGHQRKGLGRQLVRLALDRFDHVRQFVLLTDDRPEQHAFYTSLGLTDTRSTPLHTFVRMPGV